MVKRSDGWCGIRRIRDKKERIEIFSHKTSSRNEKYPKYCR